MNKDSNILITGSNGMVGKSLNKLLKEKGYDNLLTPTHNQLDLMDQNKVDTYFKKHKIDIVFSLAAKVGGIKANMLAPAEFLFDNIMIESNIIHTSYKFNIEKLMYLGSSCIYPTKCKQPLKEEYLLSSKLEPTNEGYALAKIVGLKLCEFYNKQYGTNYISLMPCSIYGEYDHFDLEKSHVIASLIIKFHNAKINNLPSTEIWGTGNAKREFLYVDDVANAMLYFMEHYNAEDLPPFINIGYNNDVSIKELANLIKDIIGYKGDIMFDKTKPEGMKRKLLDSSISNKFGWKPKVKLEDGLRRTYIWYLENKI